MKDTAFVHLHVHTGYSLLDGACRVPDLIETAKANAMPALAITDHGVMYGAIDFYKAARAGGVKPLIGCEIYVAPGSRFDRKSDGPKVPAHHLVLLAENNAGYANLARLVTAAHLEGYYYKPRIDHELLAKHHEGLIGLSACLKGEVCCAVENGDAAAGLRAAGLYADILGKDNFFLEIQENGLPEQRTANKALVDLARRTGLPLVATNDVHYLQREHAAAHEVLLCLQTQTTMSDEKRMRYRTDQFYFRTPQEMQTLFRDHPDALQATVRIAERCNVEFEFGKLHFPIYQVPSGKPQEEYLLELSHDGLRRLYGIPDPLHPATDAARAILQRLHHELAIVKRTGFINYFLVVWDFIHFARGQGIPVGPGRGSGGGSLVAYALGITAIDPLRYNLIFERFLNPDRVSPPDFDIDFCQTRRGEVIEYVKQKYGRDCVAQIITFGSLGPKTVIRDVGRVLGISFGKCDQLAKLIPEDPKITLASALEKSPEFKHANATDGECQQIMQYALVLEGLQRNQGVHAAGVVIGEKPLSELIPLSRDKDKETITQYAMEPLADIGLLKMDFLGLKTLTVIRETVELIRGCQGKTVDVDNLPLDDRPTYALLSRGDTVGVFQLESSGMRQLIRDIGVNNIEDLIAVIALYRPGPMEMLPSYIARKTGKESIAYDHPLLAPILKDTHGVMVYQEQVQQAANVLAGYSLGQADLLRRAMGKKKKEIMDQERGKFVEGCRATNGIRPPLAERIFDNIAAFAGYGFNKAHSTGYGIVSYQTAYLKANYPAEFMAALISSEIGNADKLPVFVNEAIAMGLQVDPPDVNASNVRFVPRDRRIRFGLAGIKNVGEGAAAAIVREREAKGPYTSLLALCGRVDSTLVNKKTLESLARAGAMDGFGLHRARVFNGIDFAMARAAAQQRDRRAGQGSLFDLLGGDTTPAAADAPPDCPPWHESEALAAEKELLGLYMSGHPLTQHAAILRRYQTASIQELAGLADRTPVRVGGVVAQISKKLTKGEQQQSWAILQLEDLEGFTDVFVFAEPYQRYGPVIRQDGAFLVCGEVSLKDQAAKLIAYEIYPLAEAPRRFAQRVNVHVPVAQLDDARLQQVRDTIRAHPGTTPLYICLQFPTGEKVFIDADSSYRVLADEALIAELERILGEQSVFVFVNPSPFLRPRENRRRFGGNGRP